MRHFFDLNTSQKLSVILILILGMMLWAYDAADDLAHGSNMTHILVEALILTLASFWIISISIRYFISKRENRKIKSDLESVRKDLATYREETAHLAKGLSTKIDEQLKKWHMTEAEKEVALLVLKGFSNKEISTFRETSEKTTAQQISAIYSKSGLSSRSEFAAFFLEDLLISPTER